jgi:hypothetical protein
MYSDFLPDVGGLRAGLLGRSHGSEPVGAVCQERGAGGRGVVHHDAGGGCVRRASGLILSGWMSSKLGRINVLRIMIGVSIVAMPALYPAGGDAAALLYLAVFLVYWCYGHAALGQRNRYRRFLGHSQRGHHYGMLFTAWGVAGIIGRRIGGVLFDRYHNYQAAFYSAAALAAIALLYELLAKRPAARQVNQIRKKANSMSVVTQVNIDSILHEPREFACSDEFRPQAHVRGWKNTSVFTRKRKPVRRRSGGQIASQLHWFEPWDKVLDWNCPWAKWFSGGKINLSSC